MDRSSEEQTDAGRETRASSRGPGGARLRRASSIGLMVPTPPGGNPSRQREQIGENEETGNFSRRDGVAQIGNQDSPRDLRRCFFLCRFARVARCREARSSGSARSSGTGATESREDSLQVGRGVLHRVLIWPFYSGGGGGRRALCADRVEDALGDGSRRRAGGDELASDLLARSRWTSSTNDCRPVLSPRCTAALAIDPPRCRGCGWTISLVGGSISGECRRAGLFALHTEPAAAPEVVRSVKTTLQGPTHKFLIPCRGCSDCGTYAQRQNNAARVDALVPYSMQRLQRI